MSAVAEPSLMHDLRLYEEALPEPLLERLLRAVRDVGDERLAANYDTTFWFPRDRAPTNIAEEAIAELLELVNPSRECIGTEWWLGRLGYGERLPFHFDRDKSLSRATGEYVPPLWGSILYLNSFPTSPTIFLGQVAGPDGKTKIPEKPRFREAVQAVRNRYVVFSGRLRHGIRPDVDGPAGERAHGGGAVRLTLLVNYWHRRPCAPICRDFDGTIYVPLQYEAGEKPITTMEHLP
jgi:hypothetical protein